MKAMMGSTVDTETLRLLDEIRVLRARVAELEEALATAESVDHPDRVELGDEDVRIEVEAVLEPAGGR